MDLEKFMIPCLNKTLFGVDCLGCGFQRALILVFKGEWILAFQRYPAVYSMLLLFAGIVLFFGTKKTQTTKQMLKIILLINLIFVIGGYFYTHF